MKPHFEFSESELAVMERFIRAVRAGKRPDVEMFLCRYLKSLKRTESPAGHRLSCRTLCTRQRRFIRRLRPVLEGVLILDAELRRFRRRFPDADLEEMLNIP